MDFSDSYATGIQVVIVPEGSDVTLDNLGEQLIGTQRATTGNIYCTDDYGEDHVIAYDDGIVAVQDLLNGKVDAVVIDQGPCPGVRVRQPRPGHSGHRVCQRGLRHRRGQGQHRSGWTP